MSDKQPGTTLPPLSGGGTNNGGNNGGSQQTVNIHQVLTTAQGLNVLTTGGGQQFVLASQVPGLTQVLPSGATTTANLQQLGVTRIVNIGSTSPRVVGLASASGSPLSSPSRQTSTKVVLTTSPKLVRTSHGSMFVAPTTQMTGQSSPARKKLKLSDTTEKTTAIDDTTSYRRRIMEHKMKRMRSVRDKYTDNAAELFFLHAGGNVMDFHTWRKRPVTPQYLHFLRQHKLDPDDDDEDLTVPLADVSQTLNVTQPVSQEVKVPGIGVTPVAVSTTLPTAVAQLSQQGGTPLVLDLPQTVTTTNSPSPASSDKSSTTNSMNRSSPATLPGNQPVVKLVKLPTSSVTASCDTSSNQEQIVEKAKQEAYVMQRIAELQREGLWSERRLPKVQEPARSKAHWDYLLEEMVWLAADFAQERKWKKAAAKKCARMIQKHFQEKATQAQKAEKLEELRLKKIASFVAKEIKTFWSNVEKLVEYKQQTRLEEKRKKALDQHLNFIVDQTEKYSTWLTEGLNKTEGSQSMPVSINSSRISSPIPSGKQHSDDEFEPNQSSDDDEETIAKAEEEIKSNHKEEVELLKKESIIPLEDLLKELPPNYLDERDRSLTPELKENFEEENEKSADGDTEFTVASDESTDDEEDTIMEQEKLEKNVDHKQELDDLKAENEMSIDELMSKYGAGQDIPMDVDKVSDRESEAGSEKEDDEDEKSDQSESDESDYDDKDHDSQTQSEDETGVGLKSLLEDLSGEQSLNNTTQEAESNEMDDVAALAESIQPKGNTLQTTSVVTKVPFLLKHSLREYQHIGLDWLVTMYERKLNGILADEMGLGKTIQTIALLAHLACEKGNWGPHLIIVPTSVMLNWEMECKKWCPGFKILTYYGTQKDRKQKRTGWTKPNAFHICITSYKLVIQDHQSFRRKKWKYLILDEAQNIKNFKSQRWQLLLNFQTQRRLLLTGTPLQNNLMELWSLMHFLMPNVFQSHREFKEWFSNPVTGMIEGNSEYNENIIRRLHKVLRPFLLRRLKTEVEKQLPKKYEHVVMCRLSKRQRYLYDDFMSRAKTRETLASGNLLSVINVLMQLRKVCNHPNLFEVRPTISPFQMEGIEFVTSSLIANALEYDPFEHIDLSCVNLLLVKVEIMLTAFVAHRARRLKTPRKLIEEIDSTPEPPPRCPSGKIKINVRLSNQAKATNVVQQPKAKSITSAVLSPRVGTSPLVKSASNQTPTGQGVTLRVAGGQQLQGYSVQLVPHQGSVKAIPLPHNLQATTAGSTTTSSSTPSSSTIATVGATSQKITVANTNIREGLQRLTTQTVTVKQGDSVQRIAVPSGFAHLVQTATGRHILLTSNQQNANTVVTPSGQRLTVLSKSLVGLSTTTGVNKVFSGVVTTTSGGRPIVRVPQLNMNTSQAHISGQIRPSIVTRPVVATTVAAAAAAAATTAAAAVVKETKVTINKEEPKSEFHMPHVEDERRRRRQGKLRLLADVNETRCAACPLYGEDLFMALRLGKPSNTCQWHGGWMHCKTAKENQPRTRRQFFSRTEALAEAIKSTEQIVEELKGIFERFVTYVPAVQAPMPRFHCSHPPPHKLWAEERLKFELKRHLSPKLALLHPVARSMLTQFPEPRLIQYDCGKLQSLDQLLRRLKSGAHRVLIFTQMTRMLDVLEAFLNFHGHIYLRLDGATKVDQRQVLMERFNADKRIFCFILSTRSGGVGVNLTGADTVIFYDSDWNPTMDAQAQDRCHRIGQTRDVHIYRLVSDKTVEENILKKANQKRLLGDLAIEGGNFTTAYFKSSTIQDIFNVDQTEGDASTRMAEVLDQTRERERMLQRDSSSLLQNSAGEEKAAIGALESALAAAEEDLDVQAAKTAKAEAVADLAEFDENIPLDEPDKDETQISKAEIEVQNLVSQLTPVERYAMNFIEESEGSFSAAQLAAAERELEQQKKEWELDRLRALRDEEERQMRLADDDEEKPLTFGREDAENQVNSNNNSKKNYSKRIPPGRKSSRRNNRRVQADRSSSETDTSTETETESQNEDNDENEEEEQEEEEEEDEEELVNSQDDEFSQASQSQDEDESTNDDRPENGKRKSISNKLSQKNKLDLNSPRTRSRGNVKINLWTLDVSPILPSTAKKPRGFYSRKRNENSKTDESLNSSSPLANSIDSNKKFQDSDILLTPTLSLEKLENTKMNFLTKEKNTSKKLNGCLDDNEEDNNVNSNSNLNVNSNLDSSVNANNLNADVDDERVQNSDEKVNKNSDDSPAHVTRASHKSNFAKTTNDEDTENCDVNNSVSSQNRKSSLFPKRVQRTSGENSKELLSKTPENFSIKMKQKLQDGLKNSNKNLVPHVLLSACATLKLKANLAPDVSRRSASPTVKLEKKLDKDSKHNTRSSAKLEIDSRESEASESKEVKEKGTKEKETKDKEVKEKETKEKEVKETKEKEIKGKEIKEKEVKETKEKEIKSKEIKEKEVKETKEKEIKGKETKDKEAKEKEVKGKETKEKEGKSKEVKEKEAKGKEVKEKETKSKEVKEKEAKSKEVKEKETTDKEIEDKNKKTDDEHQERKTPETIEKETKCLITETKDSSEIFEVPRISTRRTKLNAELSESPLEPEEKNKSFDSESTKKIKSLDQDPQSSKSSSKTGEQTRFTRSCAIQMPAPPPKIQKIIIKRRPDTPLPGPMKVGRPRKRPLIVENVEPTNDVFQIPNTIPKKAKLPPKFPTLPITKTENLTRRRPDTPMPETFKLKIKKSKCEIISSRSLSPSNQKQLRRKSSISENETNGNAESSDESDRPQRTAKVVAILTLDSQAKPNNRSPQLEVKLNKLDEGKNGDYSEEKKQNPIISLNRCESTITTRASTKLDKKKNSQNILTDIDSEVDSETTTTPSTRIMKKRIKKLKNSSSGSKVIDIQTVDIADDEEEKSEVPLKRSLRFQAPPHDKLNNSV
ncbi:helicase domino isoform X1 [Leptopilina heterotoma]|uniref:helicase domino isoform X1 n=1 Tax=Leptopilina heterotoma TaxID=63436 RepID=UPI001CA92857|nr:helicase domino isoform X1 [Leptopilina heterotoma]XP_043473180.1 helicase domino isoform X1 [Leptopilina heterotoma]